VQGAVATRALQPSDHDGPAYMVTMIVVMPETLPLAEIKAHLSEIVDRVEREHDRVVLTRNGRPAAVILSPQDLEALEDSLDLHSDPGAMAEIEASRGDVATGRVFDTAQLRAKYLP
jgi:antitoxin YefM